VLVLDLNAGGGPSTQQVEEGGSCTARVGTIATARGAGAGADGQETRGVTQELMRRRS